MAILERFIVQVRVPSKFKAQLIEAINMAGLDYIVEDTSWNTPLKVRINTMYSNIMQAETAKSYLTAFLVSNRIDWSE